jgi:Crp-like helix-turn-helix protein
MKTRVESSRRALEEHADFVAVVRRYTQGMLKQISQTTACNRMHSVQERMCRWLLMTHDRVGADEFHLTQEFLAQMLGVRRPSVTVARPAAERRPHPLPAGAHPYRRPRGARGRSCECYETLRQEFKPPDLRGPGISMPSTPACLIPQDQAALLLRARTTLHSALSPRTNASAGRAARRSTCVVHPFAL